MKKADDPRHQRRVKVIKHLFSYSFQEKELSQNPTIKKIVDQLDKIDQIIAQSAPQWPINQINKIDLAILRLAVHELLNKTAPEKVIIDEAIELAKTYGGQNSPSFINGVLGTTLNKIKTMSNQTETRKQIVSFISDQLGVETSTITPEADLKEDLNASDLEIADLIDATTKAFHLQLNLEKDQPEIKTVADLTNLIEDNLPS